MPVKNRIQLRRGSSAQWSNTEDILASGEIGYDISQNNVKIGNGNDLWANLPWLVPDPVQISGQVINPLAVTGVSGVFFDTSVGDVDQIAGQLGWNSEAGTFDVGLTDDLKISVGQSVLFRVKNSTGSTITKGEAVYASGVLGGGQIIQVAPFVADETIPEVRFIGLMLDDLANGEDGFVAEFGHIKNVDLRTTNTVLNPNAETWAVGDILFVDDTSPGGLTKVQPKDDIYAAMVLDDGSNGELFVRISDPGHINDLHDVNTSGLVDNNLLVWNSGADYWEPSSDLYYVDGQLGIGTSSPSGKLHVVGDSYFNDTLYIHSTGGVATPYTYNKIYAHPTYDHLILEGGGNTISLEGQGGSIRLDASSTFIDIGNSANYGTANQYIRFTPANTERMRLTHEGKLGIGTSDPQTLLDVSGVITATGGNSDEWNETYDWIQNSGVDGSGAANHIAYWSDSNSITYDSGELYWDSNNNRLGIGTSSPLESIEVHGIPDADLDMFSYGTDCTTFHIGRAAGTKDNPELLTGGGCSLFTMEGMGYDGNIFRKSAFIGMRLDGTPTSGNVPSQINFGTNPGTLSYPATRMTIRKDGKVGIGTTNPSYTLDVAGSGNFTGNLIVGSDLTVNGTTVIANVDTMEVEDPILTLGLASGNVVTDTNLDRGLALALNSSTTAFMGWDTSADSFTLLSSGVASNGSGNYAPGIYGDLNVGDTVIHQTANNTGGLTIKSENDTYTHSIAANLYNLTINSDGNMFFDITGSGRNYYFNVDGSSRYRMGPDYFGPGAATNAGYTLATRHDGYLGFLTAGNTDNHRSISLHDRTGNYDYGLALHYMASGVGVGLTKGLVLDNRGLVGIGTENPVSKLHTTSAGGPNVFTMENDTYGQSNRIDFITPTAGVPDSTGVIDCSWSAQGLTFKTPRDLASRTQGGFVWYSAAGDAQMVLRTHYGDLGVGTDNPQYRVHVSGGPLGIESTFYAPNIGTGEDNSVLILDSDGFVKTDEIDSRVWGSGLVDGAGTANYVSKWSDADTLTNSIIYDNGSNVGIGTASPSYKLDTGLNSIVRVGRHILKSASFLNYGSTNIDNYIGTIDTSSNGDSASLEITVYNNSDSTWRKINLTLRNMGGTNTGFNYSVYGGGGNSKLFLKYVNRSGDASKTDLFLSNGTNTLSYTHFVTVSCPTATYSASFIEDTGYSATGATSVDLDANLALALTSTGSVGIGTASPSTKLHVYSAGQNPGMILESDSTSGAWIKTKSNQTGAEEFQFGTNNTGWHVYNNTDAAYRLSIVNGGNVGIGTSFPASKLHVADGLLRISHSSASPTLELKRDGYNNWEFLVSNINLYIEPKDVEGDLYFRDVNGTTSLQIDNSANNVYVPNGNVGIGLTNPTEKLDVSGNANISGHLSASTKSFLIDHPTKEGKKLQYGSLESPYHGVRLTGRGAVVSGKCEVELPEYVRDLVHDDETVNVQITNYKHGKTLYVDSIDIPNNRFTIKNDNWFAGKLEFFWTFTATRKDVPDLIVEK